MADPHHLQTILGETGHRQLLLAIGDAAVACGVVDVKAMGLAIEAVRLVNDAAERAEKNRERGGG